jgi:hypothetical protein
MRISIRRRLDAIEAKMAAAKARTSGQTMELLDKFIADDELENAIRYLKAGRRFAGCRDDKLKSVWTKVWRAYYDHDRTELWPYCIDADAELMLRRLPRPSTGGVRRPDVRAAPNGAQMRRYPVTAPATRPRTM